MGNNIVMILLMIIGGSAGIFSTLFILISLPVTANYAQTECQFRYCGTAIPFLTVRSTAR